MVLESGTVTLDITPREKSHNRNLSIMVGSYGVLHIQFDVAVVYVDAMLPDPNHNSSYLEILLMSTFRQFASRL